MPALTHTCVQGNLQVFYQDLPFSIQDGYERFLSSSTVSLQQYQVPVKPCSPESAQHWRNSLVTFISPCKGFCTPEEAWLCCAQIWSQVKEPWCSFFPTIIRQVLSEISVLTVQSSWIYEFLSWQFGVLVLRETVEPASVTRQSREATEAEAQCQPACYIQVSLTFMRWRPHERIKVVFTCCSHPEEQSTSTGKRMEAHKKHMPDSRLAASSETAGRTWWDTGVQMEQTKRHPDSAPPRWRFSSISFPDLGSKEAPSSCLPPPDPALLPGPFSVGGCEIDPWRQRINLREVKMSARDRKRGEDKRSLRTDREVCSMA